MRRLVVCCDGTWNTPVDESVTNVRRLFNALADRDQDGARQLTYYQSGVGTEGHLLSRLVGGGVGAGLSRNVMDAYHWLTTRYEPGDQIALFGFSRGAYTVRSLAGMISAGGLIETARLDEAASWRQIKHVYERRYRRRDRDDQRWRDGLVFRFDPAAARRIPVQFVGVWDTVGALGIPDYLGWLNLLDLTHRYDFHDLRLNPHIQFGRHALAMDERRRPYTPTLWSPPFATGQDVKQVWFPGSHKDVGGGHVRMGLSDAALLWMIEEARAAVRLGFTRATVAQVHPDPLDVLHDDDRGVVGLLEPLVDPLLKPWLDVFLQPQPRAVPRLEAGARDTTIHPSGLARHQSPPISTGPYRPTRVLTTGRSEEVEVLAREPWNETGLYLEPGEYAFAAEGEWLDRGIPAGPAGTRGWHRFNPIVEKGRLVTTLSGQAERLFALVTGNTVANFVGTRREEDMPAMSLIGVIANDAVHLKGALHEHERVHIGVGTRHRVEKPGYLYAFANDAWGSYADNRGSVRLTVTRTDRRAARRPGR